MTMRGTENSIANVIYLKHQLELLPKLAAALEPCKHELLIAVCTHWLAWLTYGTVGAELPPSQHRAAEG